MALFKLAQRANQPRESDLARSALQDLRDVVSRSSQTSNRLDHLIADWRAETEHRINTAGIKLNWGIPSTELPIPVSPSTALHLSRISIDLEWLEHGLVLIIEDDGIGLPEAGAKANRGMNSMLSRAQSLGGSIRWTQTESRGCKVILEIAHPRLSACIP